MGHLSDFSCTPCYIGYHAAHEIGHPSEPCGCDFCVPAPGRFKCNTCLDAEWMCEEHINHPWAALMGIKDDDGKWITKGGCKVGCGGPGVPCPEGCFQRRQARESSQEVQRKVTSIIWDLMESVPDDEYDEMEEDINYLYAELGWGQIMTVDRKSYDDYRKHRMSSLKFRLLYHWHKWKLWRI